MAPITVAGPTSADFRFVHRSIQLQAPQMPALRLSLIAAILVAATPVFAADPPPPDATVAPSIERLELDISILKAAVVSGSAADQALAARFAALEVEVARLREAQKAASTAGSVQATPPPARVTPIYSHGFVIEDTDGKFRLRVNGLLQVQYLGVKQQNESLLAQSGSSLRRARLAWDGYVYSPRLGYKVQLDFGQGQFTPLDAFIEGHLSPHWSIRVGQIRVPFSRNWLTSEEALLFPERAIATEEFRYDYDLGILLASSWAGGRFDAQLGVFNGAGKNVPGNDNVDPMIIARLSGTPLGTPWTPEEGDRSRTHGPAVTLGTSASIDYIPSPPAYGFSSQQPIAARPIASVDVDGDGRNEGIRVMQLEADLAFRWRGLALEAEGYFRRERWGQLGTKQPNPDSMFIPHEEFAGFLAQASYSLLADRLSLGGRVSSTELSPLSIGGNAHPAATCIGSDGKPFSCNLPFTNHRTELSFVAAGYHLGGGLQASAMYSALVWRNPVGEKLPYNREQRFLAQAQIHF